MATEPPTPSLMSRLFGPTTTQGDHETSANEREEKNSERSITMSDTTENIGDLRRNLEATDLRHITPSARQEETVDNAEGDELGSHNSKWTKRNKSSSKKKPVKLDHYRFRKSWGKQVDLLPPRCLPRRVVPNDSEGSGKQIAWLKY
jgi:hypothetical protein